MRNYKHFLFFSVTQWKWKKSIENKTGCQVANKWRNMNTHKGTVVFVDVVNNNRIESKWMFHILLLCIVVFCCVFSLKIRKMKRKYMSKLGLHFAAPNKTFGSSVDFFLFCLCEWLFLFHSLFLAYVSVSV